ncbi:hypothetical protein VPG91_25070 [Nitrospirillum amazonense]|uniref:hypothetical protein n=1 Tax=Nitrospirillum amazonense TaxID=28077 RepID=UPI002DD43412|nr:hypothetical protein [Nitrospirillum amazonense]MEC4594296.1 hypothetical protein [Nitrospirillum amazonense]
MVEQDLAGKVRHADLEMQLGQVYRHQVRRGQGAIHNDGQQTSSPDPPMPEKEGINTISSVCSFNDKALHMSARIESMGSEALML